MEEPWDELMGPPPTDLKNMLQDDSPRPAASVAPVRSTPSGPPPSAMFSSSSSVRTSQSAPPPSGAFNHLPNRWAQYEDEAKPPSPQSNYVSSNASVASSSSKRLAFEDEDDIPMSSGASVSSRTSRVSTGSRSSGRFGGSSIRQEALQGNELNDERLSESSYSVRRTATGGFSAQYEDTKKKRVPSALRGMDFSSNDSVASRTNPYRDAGTATTALSSNESISSGAKPYRDVDTSAETSFRSSGSQPYRDVNTSAETSFTADDYDYDDGNGNNSNSNNVVDVAGMDRRGMASRTEPEASNKKWSSRYDVDKTLLSISMTSNSKRTLDKMDKQHARNNLFNNSEAQAPQVFGSGFSFRKKNVFGKQKVTMKAPDTNLQTVWMDMEGSSLPPANARNKSWQEQLDQKRRQRRCYVLAACGLFLFAIALISMFGTKTHEKILGLNDDSAQIGDGPIQPGSVTFYVTSDGPYDLAAEAEWRNEFQKVSPQADFMLHLGNLQRADETLCSPSKYVNMAAFLKESPITTFVLPGEEDSNNCPYPQRAWESWMKNFQFFHRNFDHLQTTKYEIMSEKDQYENFAILHAGVLFLGLHVTGGRIPDQGDLTQRNDYNFQWVEGMVKSRGDSVRAIVIVGNARPLDAHNDEFFSNVASFLKEQTSKPIVYIHAGGKSTQVYTPFEANQKILVIQIGENPLMRVNVGFGDRPFILG